MAENEKLRLQALRTDIHKPLEVFFEKIYAKLHDNLVGLSVAGSAATDEFIPGKSDINTVILLKRQDIDALNTIAQVCKRVARSRITIPLTMTADYISRSLDVFGVEFLDLQLISKTIYGDEPFANLQIKKNDVRLQCERELKAMLIRLRQGYMTAAGRNRLVRDMLISTVAGLAPLLRAMLWLNDVKRPETFDMTVQAAENQFQLNLEPLREIKKWKLKKPAADGKSTVIAFEQIYQICDRLTIITDEMTT